MPFRSTLAATLALVAAPALHAQEAAPAPASASAPVPAISFEVISEGSGASPAATDVVLIDYRGTLADGTEFDAGQGAMFEVGGVIPGFSEGLQRMRVGGRYRLTIPPALGYGESQVGPIPPNSTLTFEVTLRDAGPPERARTMMGLPDVRVEAIVPGTGRMPAPDELVLIDYAGRLADGTQFDAGQGAVLFVSRVVPGFAQGLMQMRTGGRYRLFVPADLAYGERGAGPIPPNSDLVFEVTLIAANRLSEIGAMMRAAAGSATPQP
jgi:FKBP-type peptidyl-prolyl cis-trans isomerase